MATRAEERAKNRAIASNIIDKSRERRRKKAAKRAADLGGKKARTVSPAEPPSQRLRPGPGARFKGRGAQAPGFATADEARSKTGISRAVQSATDVAKRAAKGAGGRASNAAGRAARGVGRASLRGAGVLGVLEGTRRALDAAPGFGSDIVSAADRNRSPIAADRVGRLKFGQEGLSGPGIESSAQSPLITQQTRDAIPRLLDQTRRIQQAPSADQIEPADFETPLPNRTGQVEAATRLQRGLTINQNPAVAGLGRSQRRIETPDVVGPFVDRLRGVDSRFEDTSSPGLRTAASFLSGDGSSEGESAQVPSTSLESQLNLPESGRIGRTGRTVGGVPQANQGFNPLDFEPGTGFIRNESGQVTPLNFRPGQRQPQRAAPQRINRQSADGARPIQRPGRPPPVANPYNFALPAILTGSNRLARQQELEARNDADIASGRALTEGQNRAIARTQEAQRLGIEANKLRSSARKQEFDEAAPLLEQLRTTDPDDPQASTRARDELFSRLSGGETNRFLVEQGDAELNRILSQANVSTFGAGFGQALKGRGGSASSFEAGKFGNMTLGIDNNVTQGGRVIANLGSANVPRQVRLYLRRRIREEGGTVESDRTRG